MRFSIHSKKTLCICLVFLTSTIFSTARTFTNNKGKKIDAEVISVEEDSVTLKLNKNGKTYSIKISTLSKSDQEFLRKFASEKAASPSEKKNPKPLGPPTRFTYKHLKNTYNLTENFDNKWPSLSKADSPDVTIKLEDSANKKFIYESENYKFTCDVRLTKNVVKKFAHLFEATRNFCQVLPISMLKAQLPDGSKKYEILLFETKASYIQNGGPPSSAGVYMPSRDVIMVPLSSLGVKKSGSGYRYDYDGSNTTLPHEITHQLTHPEYFSPGARGWFSEGLAEYVALTGYRGGKYIISSNKSKIVQSVTAFNKKTRLGRNLGKKINAPDLKTFMTMTYSDFTANGSFNYGLGTLITYYFFHFDKNGRDSINNFLKALNEGAKGDAALKALLNGRTFDELEKEISKAWKTRGIEITFK